jgi:hypothetical protein
MSCRGLVQKRSQEKLRDLTSPRYNKRNSNESHKNHQHNECHQLIRTAHFTASCKNVARTVWHDIGATHNTRQVSQLLYFLRPQNRSETLNFKEIMHVQELSQRTRK